MKKILMAIVLIASFNAFCMDNEKIYKETLSTLKQIKEIQEPGDPLAGRFIVIYFNELVEHPGKVADMNDNNSKILLEFGLLDNNGKIPEHIQKAFDEYLVKTFWKSYPSHWE